ncbi:M16 family metallopeptidase [Nocardioides marmorisolisilvae]|uniref:Insulinase family protein n=1 Tax=Nocardioides marmorisolisilvae TaxID=1542737 RepID=A0A3N0DW54_9ACTN|nr:pitrilysin family protein [Nocardioides marmorisolisilvae]RNL79791.1 insulinase family protein [Nocardioides marmorisolisilvae]
MTLAAEQKPGTTRTLIEGVHRTVLPGGLRVVTEHVPGVRSAAIGVFVGVGSRDETPALNGASHFLEHLLFKGTPTRSAMDISAALDSVGGEFNAYTAREYTCYHARVLDEDLPMAVDVLGDMLTSSLITSEDVEAEREVILDEIAMHDDDPDDVVHNLFAAKAWSGTSLARPIAGTNESIRALNRSQINRYYRTRYTAPAMTVAVAGNVVHRDVVRLVRKAFSRNHFLADLDARPLPPRLSSTPKPTKPGHTQTTRPFEQVNLVLGMRGMTRSDDRRYTLGVLNAAFGGGSSSRLFQEVRERRGLAYSVYSFATSYSDAGMVGVAVGSLPSKSTEVLDVVRSELTRMVESGLTQEELDRGRGQMRGGLVLSLEDTGSRMTRLGEVELFQERLLSLDEVLNRLDKVNLADVHELARDLFQRPETLAVVGP